MKNHVSLHGHVRRFASWLLSTSLAVLALGVMSTPASAAVTVDQQPLIIQRTLPPNIVLMFDDSGSMANDYMPDKLSDTSVDGFRNSSINGTYYNPATVYDAPPKADGKSSYNTPSDIVSAYKDGFRDATAVDVTSFTGDKDYFTRRVTIENTTYPATPNCANGYTWNGSTCVSGNRQGLHRPGAAFPATATRTIPLFVRPTRSITSPIA